MTDLRHQIQRPTPRLAGGDERPAIHCPRPLVDAVWKGGASAARARPRLFIHCSNCPIRSDCWADKAWREALRDPLNGAESPRRSPLTDAERANIGARNSRYFAAFNAARLADLRNFITAGESIATVCAHFGITEASLRNWCRDHDAVAEWDALKQPKQSNQHRQIGKRRAA